MLSLRDRTLDRVERWGMRGEEGVGLGVKYIAKEKIGTIELAGKNRTPKSYGKTENLFLSKIDQEK